MKCGRIKIFLGVLFCFLAMSNNGANAQENFQSATNGWQHITSIRQLWKTYPNKIRELINALNLKDASLRKVRHAVQNGDTLKACSALLAYYRTKNAKKWLPGKKDMGSGYLNQAAMLINDRVSLADTISKIPRKNNGGWDWGYLGPSNDKEFGYSLNGHHYMLNLLEAWKTNGHPKYAAFFDHRIRDWIIHNPLPAKEDSVYLVLNHKKNIDWRDISEVRWRDLEVGDRLHVWPKLFFGFQSAKSFTAAARLLMLWSIPEQASYLKKYHKKGHNWTTVEMNGLALTGLAFPKFKDADDWAKYAMRVMEKEINRQVYPDGVQTELSTMTHIKSLENFQSVANNFQKAGRKVPSTYRHGLERMYNYLAYSMRPTGYQPLNNDSDRRNVRPLILKAARQYHRPEWTYIATNGAKGKKPEGLSSTTFPRAGINIMRSGWGKNAQWAFFDTGPFGTGHQHSDKLHLSITAYGKNLLVDGGRYTHKNYFSFDPATWRGYFRSSFSHNVILVDGRGQKPGPDKSKKSMVEGIDYLHKPSFDYARGTFAAGYKGVKDPVKFTRAVLYIRGKYWIVVDKIETNRSHKITALWHYAPGLKIKEKNHQVISTNPAGPNLRIIPVGALSWKLRIVKGQKKPVIQGWHSAKYGEKKPSPAAVYSTRINRPTVFAWILKPAARMAPEVKSTIIKRTKNSVQLKVTEGNKSIIAVIPLAGKGHPSLKQTP